MTFNFQPASVKAVCGALTNKVRLMTKNQMLPLLDAEGYVLSHALTAPMHIPPHDNSAMDGYALRCVDAHLTLPISQVITAGSMPAPLQIGTAARIFTGAPIPTGADAIIAQEQVTMLANQHIQCMQRPVTGQYIRRIGEDIAANSLLLDAGLVLTPSAIGLAASVGVAQLSVVKPLRCALFFTGDELLEPGDQGCLNKIYNTSRYWLHTRLKQLRCEVIDLGIIKDDPIAIMDAISQVAGQVDVILTCGGVSVGDKDFVKAAVSELGELYLWKVAMKPGKPFAFGRIQDADFMGLPGNPVSGFIAFEIFVKPFLLARLGVVPTLTLRAIPTCAAFTVAKPDPDRETFLRVQRKQDDSGWYLEPYPNQSSGVFSSCFWANGLAHIFAGQTVKAGDQVDFLPW
ncbi:MAG: molybdopterin molybdotransferase MoeA [Neisseriales bacterium]|nr:MAG: molybdopterin molybdotransferase MoeA [Neisseriales bacterium]